MSAPSFPSFPPVFGSFPDLEASPSSSTAKLVETRSPNVIERQKREKSIEGRREKKDRYKRRKEGQGRHGDDKASKYISLEDKAWSAKRREKVEEPSWNVDKRGRRRSTTPENRSRVFFQDRKGDQLNVTYGGLHAGDVPKYSLVARGRSILGLDPHWTVFYRGGKGIEVGLGGGHPKTLQLTSSSARNMLTSGRTRRLAASTKSLLKYEEVDGFVRIPSRRGKEKDQGYRSITRDNSENSDSESSLDSSSEASEDESDTTPLTAREDALRNLEQKLLEDTTSIANWLILVEHSLSGIPTSSKNAEKARCEISISILSRALSANPDNGRSSLLRLKYLKAGESIWNESQLRAEWDNALRMSTSADVWVGWLDWRMRKCARNFSDALEDVTRALNQIAQGLSVECADVARLRVFWRLAVFFKEAGYVERSFALFQAQAELSFNASEESHAMPFEQQLDSLEEFWDAEVPRVGEHDARGWKSWQAAHPILEQDIDASIPLISLKKLDSISPYKVWQYTESESDKRLILPTRTSDINDEDPYSTVLFSDIRPFLFPLRTETGKVTFRLIWLSVLGLHLPGFSASLSPLGLDDRWADTAFSRDRTLQSLFPSPALRRVITADSFSGVMVGREKGYKSSFGMVKEWSLGTLEPLEGLMTDGQGRMWEPQDLFEGDTKIIRRIFEQLHSGCDSSEWDTLRIAFEASCPNLQSALKHSQSLLLVNSSSPELLAAYGRLERINHKYDKARKVYRVGLSSLSGEETGLVLLWWDSAELEWHSSQNNAALDIVLRAAGTTDERTGVNLLRAKRKLEELSQSINTPDWKHRSKWIKLRILLELLTGTVEAAIETAKRFQANETQGGLQHESLTITILLMVYHHTVTLRNPTPPLLLRELVHKSLEFYPSNTVVLGLLLECEKGEGVWGRVRALLSDQATGKLQEKSLARRVMEVWIANWEEGRWAGEVERVRAGLEAAVNSDRTRGSAILWKIFVKFEIAAGNLKRAKSALFRALGECPLVKELYLLAFEDGLRSEFSNRELLSLSDTMAERGLRLRRSLNEILSEHGGLDEAGVASDSSGGADDDNELEYNSRELRRLMPY